MARTQPGLSAVTAARPWAPMTSRRKGREIPQGPPHPCSSPVNEELAATALWGTQQLGFAPPGSNKYDGVFGIWYGKGPGVDRCSDVFKHANMAGTTPWGGVIAVAGDDHISKSSTAAHQSDHIFGPAARRCSSDQCAGDPGPGHPCLCHEPLLRASGPG